jgi:hypothetical protein
MLERVLMGFASQRNLSNNEKNRSKILDFSFVRFFKLIFDGFLAVRKSSQKIWISCRKAKPL